MERPPTRGRHWSRWSERRPKPCAAVRLSNDDRRGSRRVGRALLVPLGDLKGPVVRRERITSLLRMRERTTFEHPPARPDRQRARLRRRRKEHGSEHVTGHDQAGCSEPETSWTENTNESVPLAIAIALAALIRVCRATLAPAPAGRSTLACSRRAGRTASPRRRRSSPATPVGGPRW